MRVAVFSDSHSARSFMRRCVDILKPDAIIHLGDHYDDGEVLREAYPTIPLYQVAGNCDRYRKPPFAREVLIDRIGGVDIYMTHGHVQRVKSGTERLLAEARVSRVQAVLYGHTHCAECRRDEDGMWVMNPGSCGYGGGTAGLIEIQDRKIVECRILRDSDLEEFV